MQLLAADVLNCWVHWMKRRMTTLRLQELIGGPQQAPNDVRLCSNLAFVR